MRRERCVKTGADFLGDDAVVSVGINWLELTGFIVVCVVEGSGFSKADLADVRGTNCLGLIEVIVGIARG